MFTDCVVGGTLFFCTALYMRVLVDSVTYMAVEPCKLSVTGVPVWQPAADTRDRRSSMSSLCWHHDTTSAVDSSSYPRRPRLSGGCSACMEVEIRACSSLLTFQRETNKVSPFSSVILYGWGGAVYSDGQETSALSCAAVLNLDFCKVPPQLCDGSTLIHDICSCSSSSSHKSIRGFMTMRYINRSTLLTRPTRGG